MAPFSWLEQRGGRRRSRNASARGRAAAVVAVLAGVVVGCGNTNADTTTSPPARQAEAQQPSAETGQAPVPERRTHTMRSLIRDPAGDPGDGNGGVHPDRSELDITSAALTRTSTGDLLLRMRFAGTPGPNSIYVLTYNDASGNAGGVVETRVDADGVRTTTSDLDFSQVVEIPGAILSGTLLMLRVPRDYVQPLSEWSVTAATREEALEVLDDAPDQDDDLEPESAPFPDER